MLDSLTLQETNREVTQLITELLAAWNAHDVDRAAALYAPDYQGLDIGEAMPQQGPDGLRQSLGRYLRAFPDLYFILDETVVQDDRVVLAWTACGTHRGRLMNIPPTGREIVLHGVTLLNVTDGKISRASYIWDVAGLLRGLGLLPEL